VAALARRRGGSGRAASIDERLRARLPRILGAAAAMGVVLAGGAWALDGPLHDPVWRYGALALLCGAGVVAYFAAAFGLGAGAARRPSQGAAPLARPQPRLERREAAGRHGRGGQAARKEPRHLGHPGRVGAEQGAKDELEPEKGRRSGGTRRAGCRPT
jgi:hypothetical protein